MLRSADRSRDLEKEKVIIVWMVNTEQRSQGDIKNCICKGLVQIVTVSCMYYGNAQKRIFPEYFSEPLSISKGSRFKDTQLLGQRKGK